MNTVQIRTPRLATALEAATLEARMRQVKGVLSAVYNPKTSVITIRSMRSLSLIKLEGVVISCFGQKLIQGARDVMGLNQEKKKAPIVRDDDISKELKKHKKGAILSIATLAVFEVLKRVNPALYASITTIRALAVMFMAKDLFQSGFMEAVKERKVNADTLTLTAVAASILNGKPESSLSLLAISNFSEALTILAAQKARKNISDLVSLDTQDVWLRNEDGTEKRVSVDQVSPGMIVSIHTGEKICVDGVVIRGEAAVDQAAITGESMPVTKKEGDKVYAGSNIRLGNVSVRVEKVGDDTSISRIVHMVEEAHNRRAPIQNYADKMAQSLVPVSFIAAGVVYLITRDLQRVLNMLFIDFSCGLKLSTATAMSAAISKSAEQGVLVKGGSFIESAAAVDTVVLDKTGTITQGKPQIVNIATFDKISENTLLALCSSAETHSSHPMATAIIDEAKKRELVIPPHLDTKTIMARGIEATIDEYKEFEGGTLLVGSRQYMVDSKVTGLDIDYEKVSPTGSIVYVAANEKLVGILECSDPIRVDFKRAINRMRYSGIEQIVMLTGDNKDVANKIAKTLHLDDFKAEVLPEDKANVVADLQRRGSVLMVGDGINDAPALAYADVGIAMGTNCTDTAIETADVTINSEDPLKLPEFIALGKKTMGIVHQNFAVTIAVNTAAMMLGALGFINPLVASVVHNASTLGVVLNSSRVLLTNKKKN